MTRPTVLLLPGLTCDRTVWAGQLDALDADCRVPDYRALNSLPAMAQAVLNEAPERFALAGHSMGGRVAVEVLRLAPQRVTHVALLDTGYKAREHNAEGETEVHGRERLVALAYRAGMRAMAQEWVQGMVHPAHANDEVLIEAIVAMIARQSADDHAAQIHALIHRPDATAVLQAVRCKALVLCGRQDSWSPVAQHQAIAALIPGSELTIIDNAGHMAPMEQPAAVAGALHRWLHG